MARAPDERYDKAYELFQNGLKLVEIASQLNLPEGTVRRWKSTHKWDSERSDKKSERSHKNKGGQPGNKNATGPPENKNAEKHGFFSKYLPEETFSIIQEIQQKDPLDILWENIQIAYAAIVRAQQIMHVKDKDDLTKVLKRQKESSGEKSDSWEKEYELQFAWDKQANFLQAQARAQTTLNGMIKQYDELLHKNWELASEEQKARIAVLKAKVEDNTEKPIQITFKKASESHG
ncbi:phage terminase small subunit [Anaerocolumna jejuensis]|uniref:phage terminase small subunit n=1 Tax=Anaerocolumna jejuensis TaxID=259063 RepID=UPI003F7B71B9